LNKLGSGLNGKGKWGEGVCGVNECTACWVEWLLLVSVVIAEIVTLRWDAGYVEKWVELLAEQAREEKEKLRAEKEAEEMENGEKRQEGVVVEGEYRDEKVERADEDEEVGEEKSG
jgi:hypothetical protein